MFNKSTFNLLILSSIVIYSIYDLVSFYNRPSADFSLHLLYLIPTYYGLLTVSKEKLSSFVWINRLLTLMAIAVTLIHFQNLIILHTAAIFTWMTLVFLLKNKSSNESNLILPSA